MVLSLQLEDHIQDSINSYYKDESVIGILTGKLIGEKFYVLRTIRTPVKVEDEAVTIEPDVEVTGQTVKNNGSKKSTNHSTGGGDLGPNTLDDKWIITHSKQVLRMLTGGVDIVGMFVMASQDVITSYQAKLRKILNNISKKLDLQDELILMQICKQTKQIKYMSYDSSYLQSPFKPLEMKSTFSIDQWHSLESTLNVDWPIYVDQSYLSHSLSKQIQNGLDEYCNMISESIGRLNHHTCVDSTDTAMLTTLSQRAVTSGKTKKGKKDANTSTGELFQVELLSKSRDLQKKDELQKCGSMIAIRGRIKCKASVPYKTTVHQALQALKNDMIRSIRSRCLLLCEDLLQSEEQQDKKVFYEMPIRVFITRRGVASQFSDYMFQDEELADSLDRIRDLLDCPEVNENDLDTGSERIPQMDDFTTKEGFEVEGNILEDSIETQNNNKLSLTISLVVCIFGVLFSSLYYALSQK